MLGKMRAFLAAVDGLHYSFYYNSLVNNEQQVDVVRRVPPVRRRDAEVEEHGAIREDEDGGRRRRHRLPSIQHMKSLQALEKALRDSSAYDKYASMIARARVFFQLLRSPRELAARGAAILPHAKSMAAAEKASAGASPSSVHFSRFSKEERIWLENWYYGVILAAFCERLSADAARNAADLQAFETLLSRI